MGDFKLTTIINGIPTVVVVKEPANIDEHEFLIAFLDQNTKQSLLLQLKDGRWKYSRIKKSKINMELRANTKNSPINLDLIEIEAIGLEIAKIWISRLSDNLQTFKELF